MYSRLNISSLIAYFTKKGGSSRKRISRSRPFLTSVITTNRSVWFFLSLHHPGGCMTT